MTREDDGPTLRVELRPHAQAHLVSLPAKQLRVYRPHEGVHAIEAFWCRAGRQPFEIAVRTRDVSVRAGCDVDDDFSTLRHEYRSPLARGAGSELIAYTANVRVDRARRLASRSKANHKLMKRLPALRSNDVLARRRAAETDDIAVWVFNVEILRAPSRHRKRPEDLRAVGNTLFVECLDAVDAR